MIYDTLIGNLSNHEFLFICAIRNPSMDSEGAWCFTIENEVLDMEYCGIRQCGGSFCIMCINSFKHAFN